MRVFIGVKEISGIYTTLGRGLRDIGVNVHVAGTRAHRFRYRIDPRNETWLIRFFDRTERFRVTSTKQHRWFWLLANKVSRWMLCLWAIGFHDVLMYSFGTSILARHRDLRIARAFGRRVVCNVGHGSEVRPPYINGALFDRIPSDTELQQIRSLTKSRRSLARTIERLADEIVALPMTSHFFSRQLVNWFALGIPVPEGIPRTIRSADRSLGAPLRVLHAPSSRHAKGTWLVREVVSRLREEGVSIELEEVSGVSHDVVIRRISEADLVFDQAFSDSPMPTISTEAAAMGVPCLVGGYAWDLLKDVTPDERIPPTICVRPDELAAKLRDLATDSERRLEIGELLFQFATEQQSSDAVARRYLKVLRGEQPEEWMFDPSRVVYTNGVGLSSSDARESVTRFVNAFGHHALGLNHNLLLKNAFMEFMN